ETVALGVREEGAKERQDLAVGEQRLTRTCARRVELGHDAVRSELGVERVEEGSIGELARRRLDQRRAVLRVQFLLPCTRLEVAVEARRNRLPVDESPVLVPHARRRIVEVGPVLR